MTALIEDALPGILKGRAKSTQDQYRVAAKKLQAIFVEFSPEHVQPHHVYEMQDALSDTPNMANRCLTVLRMVCVYGTRRQRMISNPCNGVERLPEAKRDRLIEHNEFASIRAQASARLGVMMDLAYLTGQRLMDVVTIHRTDLREDGIYFRQAKTDAKLIVRWTPELRAAVERAKALGGKVNALTLFHTRRGTPPAYRTVHDEWARACQKAGIEDTDMRDIRAMAATNAKRQGRDATALLGHASPQMTNRYLRGRDAPVVDGPVLDIVQKDAAK